jgi:hypothetical protein
MTAANVFAGSDGEVTKAYYAELEKRGPIGLVALNLFRAQKCSRRAKVYRGGIRGQGSFKSMAYDRKSWSIANLCTSLQKHAEDLKIRWGWKEDPGVVFGMTASHVLYVDLPQGQCSFHSPDRGQGPEYAGCWDVTHLSEPRILAFCDAVMKGDA